MKKITPVLLLAFAMLAIGCASPTKQFSKRLRGTWQVANYDVERPNTRSASASVTDFGSITFNKNGTGSLENPSIFDNLTSGSRNSAGRYDFRWSNTENIVVLKEEGSIISKSWIVITNKKSQQVWKSTDGTNQVKTIELRR
ncbi:MAG: hypothetical protein KF734_05150 [Saprospiraceae bacterium]|nr:hypothetical protein [Saprospiraceae bacterium]